MSQVLLVTSNPLIETEFRKIATLTDVTLRVVSHVTQIDVEASTQIFVDHDTPLPTVETLIDNPNLSLKVNLALVLATPPTAKTWAIAQKLQAQHVALLPESREWLIEHMKDSPKKFAQVISLTPAVGGAGTSTLAGALAIAWAKQNCKVVVIDGDSSSVGLDVTFGMDQEPGMRWSHLLEREAQIRGDVVLSELPQRNGVYLLSNDSLTENQITPHIPEIIDSIQNICDYIIIDNAPSVIPRIELTSRDLTVNSLLVMTNSLRACAVAHSLLKDDDGSNTSLVVREIAGADLAPLSIAQSLNRPLWGSIASDSRVVEFVEQGLLLSGSNSSKFNRSVTHLLNQLSSENDVALAS